MSRLEWWLSGEVRNFATVDPPVVLLGERSILEGPFPQQTVRLAFLQPVDEVTVDGPAGVAVAIDPIAPDSEVFDLRVQVGQCPLGAVERDVTVHARGEGGELLPAVEVSVSGSVVPDVEVIPSALTFGARRRQESAVESVTLRSRSGREFRVQEVVTTSESVQVLPKRDEPFAYSITQEIEETGFHSTSVTFRVMDEEASHVEEIVLLVRYVGSDPGVVEPEAGSD